MICSGWRTYGTICCVGSLVQPVSPANAADAAITFSSSRRSRVAPGSLAPWGNSFSACSRNSGVSASSSRLRQNRGVFPLVVACRSAAMSTSCLAPFFFSKSINPLLVLTVTRRAIRQLLHFVFLHEPAAESQLVAGRLVKRIEHFRARTKVILRRVMTFETPAHIKGLAAPGDIHFRNGAVASRAADTLRYVNAVIEVNEVRHSVHARPGNRFSAAIARAHGFEHRGIRPNLRMTGHAGLRCRHPGRGRHFHGRMAIPAIQTKFPHVVFVAEWYNLGARSVHFGDVGRVIDNVHGVSQ